MEVRALVSDCDRLGRGGSLSAILGYAQSEYSLGTGTGTGTGPIISREQATNPVESGDATDGNATDEEVEICITRLNFYPDHEKRLYMDCQLSLPAGRIQMRGGAEAIVEPSEAEGGPGGMGCSPEMRYERLRSSAVEQQRHWRLLKQAFECPLSQCPAKVTATDLLGHCLVAHPEIITLELRAERPISLKLLGQALPEAQAKSHCVGLLIFDSPRRVALNSNLPRVYSDWEGRPPILIMLWKTSWDSRTVSPLVTHLYILWLLCPQAQPALMVNVRVKDNPECRKLVTTCPNPQLLEESDLLGESPLFMRFTHREMKELTGNYSQDIELEFTIKENEQENDLELPDGAEGQRLSLEEVVIEQNLDRKRYCSSHFDNFDIDIDNDNDNDNDIGKKISIQIAGHSKDEKLSNLRNAVATVAEKSKETMPENAERILDENFKGKLEKLLEENTSAHSKENTKDNTKENTKDNTRESEAILTSKLAPGMAGSGGSSDGSTIGLSYDEIRSDDSLDVDLELEDERLLLIPVESRGNLEVAEPPEGDVYFY